MVDMERINHIRPMYASTRSIDNASRPGDVEMLASSDQPQVAESSSMAIQRRSPSTKVPSIAAVSGKDYHPITARLFPEEEDEDILRESSDRFVVFPIKYREVRETFSLISLFLTATDLAGLQASPG